MAKKTTINLYYTGGVRAKIMGIVTGRIYEFNPGLTTPVDSEDASEFLKLTKKTGCCGQKKKNAPVFVEG